MATLVNRNMYWALYEKVIPCRVVGQDLETATVEVLLGNGARHRTSAYDVQPTLELALARQRQLIELSATCTFKFLGSEN